MMMMKDKVGKTGRVGDRIHVVGEEVYETGIIKSINDETVIIALDNNKGEIEIPFQDTIIPREDV